MLIHSSVINMALTDWFVLFGKELWSSKKGP